MTEPPIQAPPNWRPGGRETMAAGIVRQFKEEIWNASELVRFWAGRDDKPGHVRTAASSHITNALANVDKLKSMGRLDEGRVQQFKAFGERWNSGASWTDLKPTLTKLNADLADLQP
jgi:hypothetical protein